jgi:hypothetical protein
MPRGIYKHKPHSELTKEKMSKAHLGEKHHNWKGGISKQTRGYISIYSPGHPFANKHKCVFEHRLVMEKHIGRYLKPEESVHHVNNIHCDNCIKNLILFNTESSHQKYHRQIERRHK